MAITFTDWDNGIDDGIPFVLDWTDADAIRGHLLYRHSEALRRAINERILPVDVAAGMTPIPEYVADEIPLYDVGIESLDYYITLLLDRYNDPTLADGSGTYNSQTAFPHLSTARIETILGESRLYAPKSSPFIAAWAKQVHDILNLCIWRQLPGVAIGNYYRSFRSSAPWVNTTWADALAKWYSDTWSEWQHVSGGWPAQALRHGAVYWFPFLGPAQYKILRIAMKWDIENASALDADIDIYGQFSTIDFYGFSATYENNDYPTAVQDKLFRLDTLSVPATSTLPTPPIGQIDTVTATEPAYETERGWQVKTSPSGLAKYDITGGFTFQ